MIAEAKTTVGYRSDIDGMRAIAVLAVVFYHYGIGGLRGGFVGVDVFFVISGYLITAILHKEISRGDFTYASFYERRVRRIFPALFAMLLVTFGVGAWLLLPSDWVLLGKSTLATLLFGSNVLFWRQSGYFDTSSEYNPLLHTWSLAVEEQFYIGLPILLFLLHRYLRGGVRLKLALLVCALASFAVCLYFQAPRPTATFFLSPFRAWELLAGSLLAVGVLPPIKDARMRAIVSLGALTTLLGSLWWIEAGPAFPGWQAAIPVVATAILLHAGAGGAGVVQRLLSLRPVVFVGLISYSLYLWHWPLLVFARYRNAMEPLEPRVSWLLFVSALVLATASYRLVETPFRRRPRAGGRYARHAVFVGAFVGSVLLGLTAGATRIDAGWRSRFAPEVVALDAARHPVIPFKECDGRSLDLHSKACRLGVPDGTPTVLLWGDSHALAWAPALDAVLKREGKTGLLAANSACAPLLGIINPVDADCHDANDRVMAFIRAHHFDLLILHASWMSYSNPLGQYSLTDEDGRQGNTKVFPTALRRTLDSVVPRVGTVLLVGPTPGAPDDIPFALATAIRFKQMPPPGREQAIVSEMAGWFWHSAASFEGMANIVELDPSPWFKDGARYRYVEGKQLLYRDGGHLSAAGADFVAGRLTAMSLFEGKHAAGHATASGK